MKWITTFICLICGLVVSTSAQDLNTNNNDYSKSDAAEFGIHGGHFFSSGNIEFNPGFAVGIHLRKSLDYVFSLRGEFIYGKLNGEDAGNVRSFESTWFSGSLDGIVSLNNLKWFPRSKKVDLFALAGIGVSSFSGELIEGTEIQDIERITEPYLDAGFGISFKVNPKINIGIEHKVFAIINSGADKIDGVVTLPNSDNQAGFKDIPNYTSVRINFNLGKTSEKTEPRYWLMPIEGIVSDVDELKNSRITLTDDDNDGVINQLDEEEGTPEGSKVNPKGVAIDSDQDGLTDDKDEEPFSKKGAEVDEKGIAKKEDVLGAVNVLLDEKLKTFKPKTVEVPFSTIEWYLPSIFFVSNSATITPTDIGIIHNVSNVMKSNSDKKFVIIGFADSMGSDTYNQSLSYNRAKAIIEALEEQGISRSQMILQYKGESEIGPSNGSLNRRVDFRIGRVDDGEMSAPINPGN